MSLQGADDVDLDPEPAIPRSPRSALSRRSIGVNPENRGTTARHYSRGGTPSYKALRHCPEAGVPVETRPLQVVARVGRAPAAARRPDARLFPRRSLPRCVQPAIGVAGSDRQRRVRWVREHEVLLPDHRRDQPLSPAVRPRGPAAEEEGHVRAHLQGGGGEATGVSDAIGTGEGAEHGRRVGAPAAQASRDRDALLHRDLDAIGDAEPAPERLRSPRGQVAGPVELGAVRDAAGHLAAAAARDPDPDGVGQVERYHERLEVVVAVGAQRPHPQYEVHLGGGARQEVDRLGFRLHSVIRSAFPLVARR